MTNSDKGPEGIMLAVDGKSMVAALTEEKSPKAESNTQKVCCTSECRGKSRNKADDDFNENFRQAQDAILEGVQPELISTGSSGSYFVKNRFGETLAVFKPRDEEPFAPLNPKWPKFFQRWLCFCCFGRACLVPNHGYMSEAGASIVDERLGLNVVPKTRVVKMESPAFTYGQFCGRPRDPYPKEGSYQIFVRGYEGANVVLARWEANPELLTEDEADRFLYLFQKMCVLDYVIRNTDRHTDNWLIKHTPGKLLEVAAIDNGLAFPVKHPEYASHFNHYPFKWVDLSWAKQPWVPVLREHLLALLTPIFLHHLCDEIHNLFRHDVGMNPQLISHQLHVLRGQIYNLRLSLLAEESPADLAKRNPITMKRRYKKEPPPLDAPWEDYFKMRVEGALNTTTGEEPPTAGSSSE